MGLFVQRLGDGQTSLLGEDTGSGLWSTGSESWISRGYMEGLAASLGGL